MQRSILLSVLRTGLSIGLFSCSLTLNAQTLTPTPAQIEQFKALSPSEQQALAKSFGVDLSTLAPTGAKSQPQIQLPQAQPTTQIVLPAPQPITDVKTNTDASVSDAPLRIFGSDVFSGGSNTFSPATDIPVPVDYVMGPGDTLVVQLYGKENTSFSLVINREGQIQFPNIGPVSLAGLSFSQAQALLSDVVEKQMIGVKSSITMGALRNIRIFVLGDVLQPGSFSVGSLATMTNALFASGGISKIGSLRNIQLKRQGQVVTRLDLYDLLLKGDTSNDARLMPGDVIFVPVGQTITINGAVTRPAIYELNTNASIEEVLALAGGATTSAFLPVTRVERISANGERALVNLDLTKSKDRATRVKDGDKIKISSVLDFVREKVTLSGHIKRQGQYAWTQGSHFSDAINTIDMLLPNPDVDMALIKREKPGTRQIEAQLFSPKQAWANKHSAQDPRLQSNDEIFIFNFETDRSKQLEEINQKMSVQSQFDERLKTVSINGNVRFPGTYPLADGMTTDQLVALAGGLTESAQGTQGEITRYSLNEKRERVVMHVQVDFSSPSTVLEPQDTLFIKQIPKWKNKETVEIAGEVVYPGTYTLMPGETLMDLINRAGGLTANAYPDGAVFSRAELRRQEAQRVQELKTSLEAELAASAANPQTGKKDLNEQEANKIIKSLGGSKLIGRLVIDLPLILKSPKTADFPLEDGDRLIIPIYNPSVSVVGEVQFATSHFYNAKLDAKDYIDRSGGTKKNADLKRIYVVKANGSVIPIKSGMLSKSKSINPGDTVVIPLETDKRDSLDVWAKAMNIIYQSAIGAGALAALK